MKTKTRKAKRTTQSALAGSEYGLIQSQLNLAKQISEVRAAKGVLCGLDLEASQKLLNKWERGLVEQMQRYERLALPKS